MLAPSLQEPQTAFLWVPGPPSVGLAGGVPSLGVRFQLSVTRAVKHLEAEQPTPEALVVRCRIPTCHEGDWGLIVATAAA